MKISFEKGKYGPDDLCTFLNTDNNKKEKTNFLELGLHLQTLICNEIRLWGNANMSKNAFNELWKDAENGIEWALPENEEHIKTWIGRNHLEKSKSYPKFSKTLHNTQKERKKFPDIKKLNSKTTKQKVLF